MRSNVRLYTHDQFEKASDVERIVMCLVNPERFLMTKAMADYYEQLIKVYAIVCEWPDLINQLKLITEALQISNRAARKAIADAKHLFGYTADLKKDLEKQLRAAQFKKLSEKAIEDGDYRSAVAALKEATKLEDLYNPIVDPNFGKLPTPIWTDNPLALNTEGIDEAESDLLE